MKQLTIIKILFYVNNKEYLLAENLIIVIVQFLNTIN